MLAKPHLVRLTDLTAKLFEWLLKEELSEVKLSTMKAHSEKIELTI